jgi:hypothetical protein
MKLNHKGIALFIGIIVVIAIAFVLSASNWKVAEIDERDEEDIMRELQGKGTVSIMVKLRENEEFGPYKENKEAYQKLINEIINSMPTQDFKLKHTFQTDPSFAATVSMNGFNILRYNPHIKNIYWDAPQRKA